eukprot:484140-Pelagomonas_calceolata.AAC.11
MKQQVPKLVGHVVNQTPPFSSNASASVADPVQQTLFTLVTLCVNTQDWPTRLWPVDSTMLFSKSDKVGRKYPTACVAVSLYSCWTCPRAPGALPLLDPVHLPNPSNGTACQWLTPQMDTPESGQTSYRQL